MKRLFIVFLMLIVISLAGCGSGEHSEGLGLYDEPGVDPYLWVEVPAGGFLTGQFNHPGSVDYDFEIMATEVTNRQYADYLQEAYEAGIIRIENGNVEGYYPGDEFEGGKHEEIIGEGYYLYMPLDNPATRISLVDGMFVVLDGYEYHPVSMVSWFGANAYAEFYGYRLPTELEWEKAARGTDDRAYPWGNDIGHSYANYYHSGDPFETDGGYSDTTPVGFYNGSTYGDFQTVNARSPYGVYDMAGNVGEWTADDLYKVHYRNIRGGSKATYEIDLRVWKVDSATPEHVSPSVGFRCVR